MKRTATAVWVGGPQAGEGSVSTSSGVFNSAIYTFGTTSIDFPCTNPCEMLAAAEASCLSLMVAKELAAEGILSHEVETCAEMTVVADQEGHSSIPRMHLIVKARTAELDDERFQKAVQRAKQHCPITRTLKCEVTVETVLEPMVMAAVAN